MSRATPMFNVDRWAVYTKQRLRIGWFTLNGLSVGWPQPTPKQNRRMLKKARSNGDYSLGMPDLKGRRDKNGRHGRK